MMDFAGKMKAYRIELYEIIGDGGQYFHVTVAASTAEKAIAAMRKVYRREVYRLAACDEVES